MMQCFNPHARVGRDRAEKKQELEQKVSIHTPAWGVTNLDVDFYSANDVSIHTPAWGVTSLGYEFTFDGTFQSTRPRGA